MDARDLSAHPRLASSRPALAAALLALAIGVVPCAAGSDAGALVAAPDGRGGVDLFWIPVANDWPAGGWRVERIVDDRATVVADRIGPGADADAMASLDEEDAASVVELADRLAAGELSEEERSTTGLVLGVRSLVDLEFGRAIGLRFSDHPGKVKEVRYRVSALDVAGAELVSLVSEPVRPDRAPVPPAPPGFLAARSTRDGVELTWTDPPPGDLPVAGYVVERVNADGRVGLRTPRPVLRVKDRDPKLPAFVDPFAPVETTIRYRVASVDLFGHSSSWLELETLVEDVAAVEPPSDLRATPGLGTVELAWTPTGSANTSGYVVARAPLRDGPFTTLGATPVAAAAGRFEDRELVGGRSYYYRVQALGPRANPGPPSEVVREVPEAEPPPPPDGLEAEVGRTRVRLTWRRVEAPVVGYLVERRAGSGEWARVSSTPVQEPLWDDHVGRSPGGRNEYRVRSVGLDGQQGPPSATAAAELHDLVPPAPPQILRASSRGGRVELAFEPSGSDQHAELLVVRGGAESEEGLVVSGPLAPTAREFTDRTARSGDLCWYALVAVDAAGNRSPLSRRVLVKVGAPELPQPAPPTVRRVAEPFPHVELSFDPPPAGLGVVVHRRVEGEEVWRYLAGPIRDASAVDLRPPTSGTVEYRLLYQATNEAVGPPSEPVGAGP